MRLWGETATTANTPSTFSPPPERPPRCVTMPDGSHGQHRSPHSPHRTHRSQCFCKSAQLPAQKPGFWSNTTAEKPRRHHLSAQRHVKPWFPVRCITHTCSTLAAVFADVSRKSRSLFAANVLPSSYDTCRLQRQRRRPREHCHRRGEASTHSKHRQQLEQRQR